MFEGREVTVYTGLRKLFVILINVQLYAYNSYHIDNRLQKQMRDHTK